MMAIYCSVISSIYFPALPFFLCVHVKLSSLFLLFDGLVMIQLNPACCKKADLLTPALSK